MKAHYMQPDVGHYGVFNGSRFRAQIVPRIVSFMASHGRGDRARAKPRLVRSNGA
jgi:poly(3-hydroxybutyrate) depolymerase